MTTTGPGRRKTTAGAVRPADPRRALTSVGLVVYDWDLASDRITWGGNAAEVLGLPDTTAWSSGERFAEAVHLVEGMTRADAILNSPDADAGGGVPYAATYHLRLACGRLLAVDDTGRWFANAAGHPAVAHGTMRLRDAGASGIEEGNPRAGFLAQVAGDVSEALEARKPLTIFAIALDNLPELNEELGVEGADQVISTVLARLCATMRGRDRFVRYGGNRFALALRGCGPDQSGVAAERLSRFVCAEPVGTAQGPRAVRLVIGGASAPDHALDAPTLLNRAEATLGLAKRRAGAQLVMYDAKLFRAAARGERREPLLESIEMLNARRVAIAFQPVLRASTREHAFSEALLRVEGRDGRIRPAGDVVPALERAGLVHLADECMVELVVEHLVREPGSRVAVNVSPVSLDRPEWLATFAKHVGTVPGIAPRLILEITETAAIRDPETTRRALEACKALGVAIAIDDFGAGHTSFRHLRGFPVDIVKIDGAFVQNLSRSPDDRFFVRTLIDLARHLGVETVAEWVEDEESALLLASWGVDFLQGDHCGSPELARPAPPSPASLVA